MAKSGEINTFPYAAGGIGVPYTDGLVSGVNVENGDTTIMLPTPNSGSMPMVLPTERGHVQDYYGNTSCVDTNTTGHEVFAGDF